jgi:hypothetical protein
MSLFLNYVGGEVLDSLSAQTLWSGALALRIADVGGRTEVSVLGT